MTTYLTYDVLDVIQPSRDGNKLNSFERPFNMLDTVTGKRDSDANGPNPKVQFPFTWIAVGRTEIQTLKDFLIARRGRAVPFWVPSYQRDLRPNVDIGSGVAAFVIKRVGYSTLMFNDSNGRRYIALYTTPSSTPVFRKVLSAAESGGGTTEDLTIDSTTPNGYNKDTCVISFLKFCRLTDDENTLEWLDNNTVRCNLGITEIPLEAP
jgi:hypothetical protein